MEYTNADLKASIDALALATAQGFARVDEFHAFRDETRTRLDRLERPRRPRRPPPS